MPFNDTYRYIDLEKTGRHLEKLMRERGYSAKDIQNILHLSCPQPVYRWMHGQTLPSVDHLFALSKVLQVHMEELLVAAFDISEWTKEVRYPPQKRMSEYGRRCLRCGTA